MRTQKLRHASVAVVVILALAAPSESGASQDPSSFVDPMIGTATGGFAFVGANRPFGMVQNGPDTVGPFYYAYMYSDHAIRGFSLAHVSGPGAGTGGDIPFMPIVGPATHTNPFWYQQAFSHEAEHAAPGSYTVTLANGVAVDLGATTRAGLQRYTFPPGVDGSILASPGYSNTGFHDSAISVIGDRRIEGRSRTTPYGGYDVYFSAEFDRPISSFGVQAGCVPSSDGVGISPNSQGEPCPTVPGRREAAGQNAAGVFTFAATEDNSVSLRIGLSFVSIDGARANLEAELTHFDMERLWADARAGWNAELSKILVEGGSDAARRSFYTALYRAFFHPSVASDVDGSYKGLDGRIHQVTSGEHYVHFSLWDTIRGQEQLLATLQPRRARDMLRSLLSHYTESGRLHRWTLHTTSPNWMNGDPAITAIVDGYCRGLLDGDLAESLYTAGRALAFDERPERYLADGYIPYDPVQGAGGANTGAANTLEYAGHADFPLALMAERLGRVDDAATLVARAGSWRMLFDAEDTGFIRPRVFDGSFLDPFDPAEVQGFREGTGWQYLWLVPHDEHALIEAVDASQGPGTALERLDHFFSYTLMSTVPAGVVPWIQNGLHYQDLAQNFTVRNYRNTQYAPMNEHDLQAPYLYDYAGQPWKTQAVSRALQSVFSDTPIGLGNNDDLGSMSAWFVWSALGLGNVSAGAPIHQIGSPLFPKATLRLETPHGRDSSTFVIEAPGASDPMRFIRSAALDGEPISRTWVGADELLAGGRLTFEMSDEPSAWGSGSDDGPPSLSRDGLAGFRCMPSEGASA